jgi:hypothetical protein
MLVVGGDQGADLRRVVFAQVVLADFAVLSGKLAERTLTAPLVVETGPDVEGIPDERFARATTRVWHSHRSRWVGSLTVALGSIPASV